MCRLNLAETWCGVICAGLGCSLVPLFLSVVSGVEVVVMMPVIHRALGE